MSKREDVLITDFVESLLMEPFLRGIDNTSVHGNGHPLNESYIRKIKTASKYGLPLKGIRGRAPDQTMELKISQEQVFSVFFAEFKTAERAAQNPDFVKLGTLIKDIVDFATMKVSTTILQQVCWWSALSVKYISYICLSKNCIL